MMVSLYPADTYQLGSDGLLHLLSEQKSPQQGQAWPLPPAFGGIRGLAHMVPVQGRVFSSPK